MIPFVNISNKYYNMRMTLIGTEVSGATFNKIFKGNKFKFLNNDLKHHEFQYSIGLNVDTIRFVSDTDLIGGLWFCDYSAIHYWWNRYGQKLGIVEIPDDARVFIAGFEFGKIISFKADKLIIKDIMKFSEVPDDFWLYIMVRDVSALQWVANQTEDIFEFACKYRPSACDYIRDTELREQYNTRFNNDCRCIIC